MNLFLAEIYTDGYSVGFLGYMDSWDTCTSMSDAKLFTGEGDAEGMAKDFIKYRGSEYTYKIVPVTLTVGAQYA